MLGLAMFCACVHRGEGGWAGILTVEVDEASGRSIRSLGLVNQMDSRERRSEKSVGGRKLVCDAPGLFSAESNQFLCDICRLRCLALLAFA